MGHLVPRVSHMTAPWALAPGDGKMGDPGNEAEKKSESPTGIEPMTSRTPAGALSTELRELMNDGFMIGKPEHFKAIAKNDNTSVIVDRVKTTGLNVKWDH